VAEETGTEIATEVGTTTRTEEAGTETATEVGTTTGTEAFSESSSEEESYYTDIDRSGGVDEDSDDDDSDEDEGAGTATATEVGTTTVTATGTATGTEKTFSESNDDVPPIDWPGCGGYDRMGVWGEQDLFEFPAVQVPIEWAGCGGGGYDMVLGDVGQAVLDFPSQVSMPIPADSEMVNCQLIGVAVPTPSYYPQSPPPNADSAEYHKCLSPETLFFIFYYMPGTQAQMTAASELYRLSWRFHVQRKQWFHRVDDPNVQTEDFEKGTYIFFDFDSWEQKSATQFTFEYKYLYEMK